MNYKSAILKVFPNAQAYHFKAYQFLKRIFVFLRYLPGNSVWFGPPRGLYHNAESFNVVFKTSPITQIVVNPKEVYQRTPPQSNSQFVCEKFANLTKACIQERSIFKLYHARYLYGYGGTVITPDDKIFLPCSPLKNEWYPDKHQSFYILGTPKMVHLEKVILVDTLCSDVNYCHWLRDHLMRFSYLKNLNVDYSQYTLVSSFGDSSYQKFSYQKLKDHGIIFKEYLSNKDIKHFQAEELVVLPYLTPAFNTDYFSFAKNEWHFLRNLFDEDNIQIQTGKRVFLSRRKAKRTSKDEVELIQFLTTKYEFEEFFLEDLNISEQASVFRNAQFIVGLHGAGFTNLCFCDPDTTVVEVFSSNFIVSDFWDIANQRGLKYFAYCDDKFYKDLNSYRLARNEPTAFNVDQLVTFLENILTREFDKT